ncbi:MAG: hypothetical protein KUG77_00725, partial [Nannocystaceae bacterium]|nr:hypothetical protein [Nannocystaceae bacterium]
LLGDDDNLVCAPGRGCPKFGRAGLTNLDGFGTHSLVPASRYRARHGLKLAARKSQPSKR